MTTSCTARARTTTRSWPTRWLRGMPATDPLGDARRCDLVPYPVEERGCSPISHRRRDRS